MNSLHFKEKFDTLKNEENAAIRTVMLHYVAEVVFSGPEESTEMCEKDPGLSILLYAEN